VGPMQAIMSGVITIFFYAMVIAAVWKLFLMASDMGEIKKLLTDIRNNTASPLAAAKPAPLATPTLAHVPAASVAAAPVAPPILSGPISLESAEALLREVAAEEQALASQQPKTA
jgi:hypothetical protein